MNPFIAPSIALDTPAGWIDRSTYIVMGPADGGFRPSVVVTVEQGVMDPYLKRHVDLQLDAMREKMAAFSLLQRAEITSEHFDQGVLLDYEWHSPEVGTLLHQHQLHALKGQSLYSVTATVPAARWSEQEPTLRAVVASFRPQTWTSG